LMLNAYYDFRNDSSFTPYVSAGLGYARIHHKTTDVYELKYYSSEETISNSRSDTDNNFAWSLGVGVKYNIYDNLSVDLAYRYFDAGKSQITYRNEWNEEFKSRVSVRSNDIMLGVTYDF
ncbi:outer membrane beta-barrel protein, partial [Escherichia coli]|uniref:outer membrane protein n=1 Tax=Escherichia coli TaxID=562 RepID=UPI0012FDE2F0